MRHFFVTVLLILASIAAVSQTGTSQSKYSGTWKLDRSKSEGLTGNLANADLMMIVEQNQKSLTVDQRIRIRNREQPSNPLTYNLDGTESEAEVVRPLAGTMKLTLRFLEKGRVLELKSIIDGFDRDKEVSVITKEYWELINGGKTLKILRTRETPGKSQQFTLFFNKQSE